MAKVKLNALVSGGKATAGPPLGPALGPLGVNIGQIIAKINEATKEFAGMDVPVTLEIDPSDKSFDVIVGKPPVSALLKNEAGVAKGSGATGTEVAGDVSMDAVKRIAEQKADQMWGGSEKARIKEVLGVARSAGITVDGKSAKVVTESL